MLLKELPHYLFQRCVLLPEILTLIIIYLGFNAAILKSVYYHWEVWILYFPKIATAVYLVLHAIPEPCSFPSRSRAYFLALELG